MSTNRPRSDIPSPSEVAGAVIAAQNKSAKAGFTPLTSGLMSDRDSLSKLRAVSQAEIEANLRRFEQVTPESIFGYSSSQTIGQQANTRSDIPTGQAKTDSLTPLAASYPPSGSADHKWPVKEKPKLPTDSAARKDIPIASGFLDYFPLAVAEIAKVSLAGSRQHHPDKPLHWDKTKSTDHADTLMRHFLERGTFDADGQRHTAKAAWRALALLQMELENAT